MKTKTRHLVTSTSSTRSTLYASILLATAGSPALAETIPCADVLDLVAQSTEQFSSIQRVEKSEFGGFETTVNLPGAQYCVIIEDVVKKTYRCTWKHPYGDDAAGLEFERLAAEIAECLGSRALVRRDQPVNHPDTYKSFLYILPNTEVRVTLKEKSELASTFVSFVVDGMRNEKSSE